MFPVIVAVIVVVIVLGVGSSPVGVSGLMSFSTGFLEIAISRVSIVMAILALPVLVSYITSVLARISPSSGCLVIFLCGYSVTH